LNRFEPGVKLAIRTWRSKAIVGRPEQENNADEYSQPQGVHSDGAKRVALMSADAHLILLN